MDFQDYMNSAIQQATTATSQSNQLSLVPYWKFCPECGKKRESDWKFCPACAQSLSKPSGLLGMGNPLAGIGGISGSLSGIAASSPLWCYRHGGSSQSLNCPSCKSEQNPQQNRA